MSAASPIPVQDITIKQGDFVSIPLEITDSQGAPVDLSEAVVNFRVWVEGAAVDTIGPIALSPADPPTGGIALIVLSPVDYTALTPRGPRYWYDVRIVSGVTVVEGRFILEPHRIR